MTSSPGLFSIPIQLVVYTYLLFRFFGYTFLCGFTVLAIFLCFNWCIQRKFRAFTKIILKLKDNRMKIITETINSLKILKLYSIGSLACREEPFKSCTKQGRMKLSKVELTSRFE